MSKAHHESTATEDDASPSSCQRRNCSTVTASPALLGLNLFRSPTVLAVFFLELAERTSYYGTVFAVSTFATLALRVSTESAFVITNLVFALAPLSAFVGALYADTMFDRTRVLIASAFVYTLGLAFLAAASSPSYFSSTSSSSSTNAVPHVSNPSGPAPFMLFLPGLLLLCIGYGAFKTCTAPLVAEGALKLLDHDFGDDIGDDENEDGAATTSSFSARNQDMKAAASQHDEVAARKLIDARKARQAERDRAKEEAKEKLLGATFLLYSAVINCGSLIGFSAIPALRSAGSNAPQLSVGSIAEYDPEPANFVASNGACVGISAAALLVFVAVSRTSKDFVRAPVSRQSHMVEDPEAAAILLDERRRRTSRGPVAYLRDLAVAVGLGRCVEYCGANAKGGDNLESSTAAAVHVASLGNVLKIFSVLPVYWLATGQTASTLQVQALCAQLPSYMTTESLNTLNTVAFLATLPILQFVNSRLIDRAMQLRKQKNIANETSGDDGCSCCCCNTVRGAVTMRLAIGFCVSVVAMVAAGFIQVQINSVAVQSADSGRCVLKDGSTSDAARDAQLPGVAAVAIPFVLSGIASAFVDPAALELAFELAAPDMRSTVMSLYLLASSLSGFLGLAVTPLFVEPATFVTGFFVLGAVLFAVSVGWWFLVRNIEPKAMETLESIEEQLLAETS